MRRTLLVSLGLALAALAPPAAAQNLTESQLPGCHFQGTDPAAEGTMAGRMVATAVTPTAGWTEIHCRIQYQEDPSWPYSEWRNIEFVERATGPAVTMNQEVEVPIVPWADLCAYVVYLPNQLLYPGRPVERTNDYCRPLFLTG